MNPEFPRISLAINSTLEYYEIGRIKSQIERFEAIDRGSTSHDYLDMYYDLAFKLHERMEDEINQTKFGSYLPIQVFLFENLKEWLTDYRIKEVNGQSIFLLI